MNPPKPPGNYACAAGRRNAVIAALFGTVPAALPGVVGTIAIALLRTKLFPSLRKVEQLE